MAVRQHAAANLRVDRRRPRERNAVVEVSPHESTGLAARRLRAFAQQPHAQGRTAGTLGSHDGEARADANAKCKAQELRAAGIIAATVSHALRFLSGIA